MITDRGSRIDADFNDVDIPKDPVLGGGAVRDIVGHGVAPRRKTAIGAEVVAIPGLKLELETLTDGFPFDGGVKAAGNSLEDLLAGHTKKERLVGGGEIAAVAADEADDSNRASVAVLHRPTGVGGGAIAVLVDVVFVLLGGKVLVVVAAKPHSLGLVEELHEWER